MSGGSAEYHHVMFGQVASIGPSNDKRRLDETQPEMPSNAPVNVFTCVGTSKPRSAKEETKKRKKEDQERMAAQMLHRIRLQGKN